MTTMTYIGTGEAIANIEERLAAIDTKLEALTATVEDLVSRSHHERRVVIAIARHLGVSFPDIDP